METRKIIGDIVDIEITDTAEFKKWTYVIRDNDGKTHYLNLFISDKDFPNVKSNKEKLVLVFKKGDKAEFTISEKGKYKNIVDIASTKEKEEADKQYSIKEISKPQETKMNPTELRILRSQCLNISSEALSKKYNPDSEDYPEKIFSFAKKIFEQAKKSKFLEWE